MVEGRVVSDTLGRGSHLNPPLQSIPVEQYLLLEPGMLHNFPCSASGLPAGTLHPYLQAGGLGREEIVARGGDQPLGPKTTCQGKVTLNSVDLKTESKLRGNECLQAEVGVSFTQPAPHLLEVVINMRGWGCSGLKGLRLSRFPSSLGFPKSSHGAVRGGGWW